MGESLAEPRARLRLAGEPHVTPGPAGKFGASGFIFVFICFVAV